MLTLADFGPTAVSQNIIGDMVAAYDTIITLKDLRKIDTVKNKDPRYDITRSCNKPLGDLKDKIVIMDLNKDCDVTLMCLNVQKAGAKAFVIIHNSNTKGTIKLPKQGIYKDSIRIPIFTIRRELGERITSMMPSLVGISLRRPQVQALASSTVLNMEAQAQYEKSHITWDNNTSNQNDYFIVEKQNPITGIFEYLSTVNSFKGSGLEQYTTNDENPIDGDNTYRIKLVMLDGTIQYSEPKTVKFSSTGNVKIFPNPTDDVLNLTFKGYTDYPTDIIIYDMQGKQIWTQHIDKMQSPSLSIPIADKTVAGQYMVYIKSKGKKDVIRTFTVSK